MTILAFDWYFLPPLRNLDGATVLVLALFLGMSVIVGAVATQAGRRAAGPELVAADIRMPPPTDTEGVGLVAPWLGLVVLPGAGPFAGGRSAGTITPHLIAVRIAV